MKYLSKKDRRHKWQRVRIYKYVFLDQCMVCGVGWKGLTNLGMDRAMTHAFRKSQSAIIANFSSTTPLVARLLKK